MHIYRGHGFGHILINVVPRLQRLGVSVNDLDLILRGMLMMRVSPELISLIIIIITIIIIIMDRDVPSFVFNMVDTPSSNRKGN